MIENVGIFSSILISFTLLLGIQSSFVTLRPRVYTPLINIQQNSQQQTGCNYNNGAINNSTIIQLGNCQNMFYFIGLNLGTPSQYFNFQFDTGSPQLWIPYGTSPTGFNQAASSTYSLTGNSGSLQYGDGSSVTGNLGNDTVGVPGTNISATGSILFATQTQGMNFGSSTVYGLVGMDINSYPNFLDGASSAGQISTRVFSLDLNGMNQTSYMYYNNGLPASVLASTIWISQYGTQHWQVQIIGASVNSNDVTSSTSSTAVIDSGTSLIVLNQDLYSSIIQTYFSTPQCYVDNSGLTNCYCTNTWPQIAFMFLGAEVYIPGSAYQFSSGNGYCQVGLQVLSGSDMIILGDIFFRGYTITFDNPNQMIGFYGRTKPVYLYDPYYFVISQYILCGAMILLTFVGIGLWIRFRRQLDDKVVQRDLGLELMYV